jgi:hypothetical protein
LSVNGRLRDREVDPGEVAEVTRRWLAGAPGIDLAQAARLLPERIWQSLRG